MLQIGSAEWIAMLVQGAAQHDVAVGAHQAARMAEHARSLLDWNRKFNLTAITDPRDVVIKHCLDAVLPAEWIPCDGPLLDMGTGGGFPGIPLKIMRPAQPMTLVDASRKKINFVKYVIRQLQLPCTDAIQARAEVLGDDPKHQGRYRVVVSRALADFTTVVRLAIPFLASRGWIILYKGPGEYYSTDALGPTPGRRFGPITTHAYTLPYLSDARTLIVVPVHSTPDK